MLSDSYVQVARCKNNNVGLYLQQNILFLLYLKQAMAKFLTIRAGKLSIHCSFLMCI